MIRKSFTAFTALFVLAAFSAQAEKVPLDLQKSTIKWTGSKKVGDSHWGNLSFKSGELEIKDGVPSAGTFVVDMNSMTCGDIEKPEMQQKLVGHLKGDDFFATDKNPEASFTIKTITPLKKATKVATHEIVGDLTIKGQTHPLTFNANVMTHGPLFHAHGIAQVDRTLYGVHYGSSKIAKLTVDKIINDKFDLDINVYAKLPASTPVASKEKAESKAPTLKK